MNIKLTIFNPKKYLLFFSLSVLLFSCGSKRDIVYFQDVDLMGVSKSINNFNPTIRPDDMLTIIVSALDQDAVRPFNLTVVSFSNLGGGIGRETHQTYLVDSNGNIDFPVLGTIKLAGLNRIQATTLMKDMLKDYIKNPIVNIRTMNFKVTVLGEVRSPGSFTIPNERITIIEALGLAGDMTIQAERKNVLVIREENGKKTYTRVDMTSEGMFNSSVYYLTQNDVIYVEPNNSRIKSSTIGPSTSTTLGVISTLITVTALIISITNR
jgi:polysaccharide export outer membrane protein